MPSWLIFWPWLPAAVVAAGLAIRFMLRRVSAPDPADHVPGRPHELEQIQRHG